MAQAKKRVQLVWWWRVSSFLIPFRWVGPFPVDGPARGAIYRWRVRLGPLEIRRWT